MVGNRKALNAVDPAGAQANGIAGGESRQLLRNLDPRLQALGGGPPGQRIADAVGKRAQIEIMAVVLVVAAMFLAMPQFTLFVLALGYVLSGPILMARGERIQKLPFLHRVEPTGESTSSAEPEEPDEDEAQTHDPTSPV